MKKTFANLLVVSVAAITTPAFAEFPDKPIEIIVGYSAGGGTDVMARTVGKFLEKELGGSASVVVKNVPGAGGQIGFTNVSSAKPDGYTLGTFNLPTALALTHDRKADYGVQSFTYLANFVKDPNTIVVSAASSYNTLKDFLAAAKAKPGAVTVGLASLGGNDHFSAIMMQKAAGVSFAMVPFKGAALARTSLIGGHVQAGTMTLSQTTAYKDQIRVLAVLDDTRSPFRPDVPTAKELGYEVQMSSLRGIVGPAGLPKPVAERLQKALAAVNANPEFQAMMSKQGNPMAFAAGQDFSSLAKAQAEVARQIWETTPWK
jgi:tripartite-type tricarboxylate transporter receptor subunit TctC